MNRHHTTLLTLPILAGVLLLGLISSRVYAAVLHQERDWPDTEDVDRSSFFEDGWTVWAPRTAASFNINRCAGLHTGNLNHDLLTDLICPYDYGGGDTRTFAQIATRAGYSAGWQSWSIRTGPGGFNLARCAVVLAADVDGDALTDLICPYDYGGGDTQTFIQQATPTGYSPWQASGPRTGAGIFDLGRCNGIHAGDVNRDGQVDLICPYDLGGDDTRTFVQEGTATAFTSWLPWSPSAGPGLFDINRCEMVLTGELNLDARTDLICLFVYENGDTRTFAQLSSPTGYTGGWQEWSPLGRVNTFNLERCAVIRTGQLNEDGRTDLICAYDYGSGDTRTFAQIAQAGGYTGGWQPWSARSGPGVFDLGGCRVILAGDVVGGANGDGLTDLICPYDFGNADTQVFVQEATLTGYTTWLPFSDRTGPQSIYLQRCRDIALAYLNPGRLADLVCHYTYLAGGSQTHALIGAAYHELFLPESNTD